MPAQRTVYVAGRPIPVPAFFTHAMAIPWILVVHDSCALSMCRALACKGAASHAMRRSSTLRMPRATWPISTPVICVAFEETPRQRLRFFAKGNLCTWRETPPPLSRRGWNRPSARRHVRGGMLPNPCHFRTLSSSPHFGPSLMNTHRISFSPPHIVTQPQPQPQPEPQPQPASVPPQPPPSSQPEPARSPAPSHTRGLHETQPKFKPLPCHPEPQPQPQPEPQPVRRPWPLVIAAVPPAPTPASVSASSQCCLHLQPHAQRSDGSTPNREFQPVCRMLATVPGAHPVVARARAECPRVLRPVRRRVVERAPCFRSAEGLGSAASSARRTDVLRRQTAAASQCAAVTRGRVAIGMGCICVWRC